MARCINAPNLVYWVIEYANLKSFPFFQSACFKWNQKSFKLKYTAAICTNFIEKYHENQTFHDLKACVWKTKAIKYPRNALARQTFLNVA